VADQPPTFAGDIAPILYSKCATCHHPGEVVPFSLLTYQDNLKQTLSAIFEYCGLPQDQLPAAEAAFAEDSQRGSNLARERLAATSRQDLTEENLEQIREALREHATIQDPDFIVPNTVLV
jgi:hypothetical protein